MDLNEIKKILELMDASKVVELEFEEEGKKLRLRRAEERHNNNVPVMAPAMAAMPMPSAMPMVPAAPQTAPAAPAGAAPARRPDNLVEIKSPLVGTFYRAPKPDADPYVNVGDEIQPEKVLCIVEAMKVMNEIKAEMHGVVKEVLVKNGQAVEFGEVLFLVEKK